MAPKAIAEVQKIFPQLSDYAAVHYLINHENFPLSHTEQEQIEQIEIDNQFNPTKTQADEIVQRYGHIRQIMKDHVTEPDPMESKMFSDKLDDLLLHRVWGYLILMAVLFLLFQSVFWMANYPMDAIESAFGSLANYLSTHLEQGWFQDLLVNGIVAGLGGIFVFIPQIMILFGIINT